MNEEDEDKHDEKERKVRMIRSDRNIDKTEHWKNVKKKIAVKYFWRWDKLLEKEKDEKTKGKEDGREGRRGGGEKVTKKRLKEKNTIGTNWGMKIMRRKGNQRKIRSELKRSRRRKERWKGKDITRDMRWEMGIIRRKEKRKSITDEVRRKHLRKWKVWYVKILRAISLQIFTFSSFS